MIRFRLLPDGGFVAGDSQTGRTVYAYPTSNNARHAQHIPEYVAQAMLLDTNRMATDRDTSPICREYDARNWALLAEVAA